MFRRMREAAQREAQLQRSLLKNRLRVFMRQLGFTSQTDGDDLLFRSQSGATVVMLGVCRSGQDAPSFGGVVERWQRGDVTLAQTDGSAVQAVLSALSDSGPVGRSLAKRVSRQPFVAFTEGEDGWRRRVATDRPFTFEDADRFFNLIREDRISALAKEHDLPMEYAAVLFDGGAA